MIVYSQAQFLQEGEKGITVAASTQFNSTYTVVQAAGLYSLEARLDLGLSYGVTTFGGQHKGNIISPSVSYYVLRGEKSHLFLALYTSYIYETLDLAGGNQRANGLTYGVVIGSLAKPARTFAVLPSLGILFQNSSTTKSVLPTSKNAPTSVTQTSHRSVPIFEPNVSFLIPIVNRNALILDCD